MKKIWNWLITSSSDPQKTALTVKAFLHTAGSVLLLVSPLLHLNINNTQIDDVIETVVQIILAIYAIVSSVVMILAFIRKIYFTLKPTT